MTLRLVLAGWLLSILCERFARVNTASRGRRGSSRSCYNRPSISYLGKESAGTKMGQFFHRHFLGEKVKLIARAV